MKRTKAITKKLFISELELPVRAEQEEGKKGLPPPTTRAIGEEG